MISTIHKNKHRAFPPAFGIFWNKKSMHRIITFDATAKYDLDGTEDDEDINKLFGWGYMNGGHHQDSVRLGWNYNNTTGRVAIYAYCYIAGERKAKWLCEILPHRAVLCMIDKIGNVYSFTICDARNTFYVYAGLDIPFEHNKKLSYRLGNYFGGNNKAPHKITIKIQKK